MSKMTTSYCRVAKIDLGKVVSWENSEGAQCFAQDINLILEDGTETTITLHLSHGCNALVLGDVISPEFDDREIQVKA